MTKHVTLIYPNGTSNTFENATGIDVGEQGLISFKPSSPDDITVGSKITTNMPWVITEMD
jgi:hypothetical protein